LRKSAFAVAALVPAALIAFLPGAAAAAPTPDAAPAAPATVAADARAAAGATRSVDTGAGIQASFYSGTISAGATQSWVWNNANPVTSAYHVGLSPVGASTTAPCRIQVVRSWYAQQFGGEREFYFTLRNTGTIACGADILLVSLGNVAGAWPTGGVNPGATVTAHWNNANPLTTSYVVGFNPSGATSSALCQFEVIRTWYQQQPGGEREVWFTLRNVGTIACQGDILLGANSSVITSSTGVLAPGASVSKVWNNANPLNAVYVSGASPTGATTTACQFQVTSTEYQQVINPPAEREYFYTLTNVGTISCAANILLGSLPA
jgi:hypothetical protein